MIRINIPNNKRHFVVAEEVRDRCVVTSVATATWRNVDAVGVQLLAIWHRGRNALLLQMRIGFCGIAAMLSTKGIVSLISISRPPPLFLWRSSRTAAHPGVLGGLDLLVSLVSWIADMLTLLL